MPEKRRFRPTMPSQPIPLPVDPATAGDWAEIKLIYDLWGVQGLPEVSDPAYYTLLKEWAGLQAQVPDILAIPLGEERRAHDLALTDLMHANRRARALWIIGRVVLRVEGPFEDMPDPKQPELWADWPLPFLEWMGADAYILPDDREVPGGMGLARDQLWGEKVKTPFATPSASDLSLLPAPTISDSGSSAAMPA